MERPGTGVDAQTEALKTLPLDAIHRGLGAKFAPFAGYDMPVQYEGLIAEHKWTRAHAGLFDVSHMGPCFLRLPEGSALEGEAAHDRIAAVIEPLVSADIKGLRPGQQRLTVLLNDEGGVLDDLIVARPALPHEQGGLYIVVNGAVKAQDFALLAGAARAAGADFARADDRALLALQGPAARGVMSRLAPEGADLAFMTTTRATVGGARCFVSCCGYTGEDGFEILAPMNVAPTLMRTLLAQPEVKPIGLGARDTLRLEAGLCLYGHELDPTISPVEADLAWTIQKRRRKAGDFPGAARILRELKDGPARKRVGVRPKDRAPARDGVEISSAGRKIGIVTSGGFSPTLNAPISMGYVETQFAAPGTPVDLMVRGQARPAEIAPLPFVPHHYAQGSRP
jgi:aminomethyltransferase